jgi:CheY-like chemotaxis protein
MLSHELRNPLAPIRNAAAILHKLIEKPEAAWCVELIGRQVDQMSHLVDDLLDMSRITRGKIRLETVPLELNTVVRMALESAKANFEERKHALTIQITPDPLLVNGDETRLTQVVVNLLTNAAKYTPPGGEITVRLHRQDEMAVLQVADNGIGMTEALVERAFDPFVQGVRTLDRSEGGLGIGLALVRAIVELHAGSVAAASPGPGQGATFTVRLPAPGTTGTRPTTPAANVQSRSRKVLVVDDNQDAADSLGLVLRMSGHDVWVANEGSQALALAAAVRPDTVMLDIGLPGMDGYKVARRMRELPGLSNVRLIAVTGHGQESDRQAAAAAGFALLVTKPVDPQELSRVLA